MPEAGHWLQRMGTECTLCTLCALPRSNSRRLSVFHPPVKGHNVRTLRTSNNQVQEVDRARSASHDCTGGLGEDALLLDLEHRHPAIHEPDRDEAIRR